MVDHSTEDDGADLVNEIIKEFPPEEKGERVEWADHAGWNRRENVRRPRSLLSRRGRGDTVTAAGAAARNDVVSTRPHVFPDRGNEKMSGRHDSAKTDIIAGLQFLAGASFTSTPKRWAFFLLVLLFVPTCFTIFRRRARQARGSRNFRHKRYTL